MSEKNCKPKQSENVKRFSWKTEKLQHSDDEVLLVVDNENKDWKGHILNTVDKLNEQQSIIDEQKIELIDCKNRKEQSEYNLHKKIRELENKFEKIPPKIREVWIE